MKDHMRVMFKKTFGTDQIERAETHHAHNTKKKTIYKYVYQYYNSEGLVFIVNMPFYKYSATFTDLRKAAIAVDTFLLKKGKKAVNILVKK